MTDHEQNMALLAERPHPSADVELWLGERYGWAVDTTTITDAPPHVMEWLTAFRAWLARFDAWRKTRRFDQHEHMSEWRMLGGDWIPAYRWRLAEAARKNADAMSDADFLRWAGRVYEHVRTIDAAEKALAALQDGER
jgi:hypothetical protein